jgi:hypothetical protein
MTTKRKLAIVALAVVGLASTTSAYAQQPRTAQGTSHNPEQMHAGAQPRAQPLHPVYQRHDTWYEFLLKQFNPTNFDYGAWMEERRQVFLNESARNPYFKYSAGVTIALLLMTIICAKQWIDYRRTLWITAEMMADLYNHDLYSRSVAEKAIRKYNDHIERCNRAIEAGQHGTMNLETESGGDAWRTKPEQVTEERDRYLRERDAAQQELETNRRTLAELSLRLDDISTKPGRSGEATSSIDLNSTDPAVVRHINNLQEQI